MKMNLSVWKKGMALLLSLTLILSAAFYLPVSAASAEANGEVVIYLLRHGKTLFNTQVKVQGWSDSVLTEAGILGAENTGLGLADIKFDAAYSSDRGRAIETAEIILSLNQASSDLSLKALEDLRETNFGKYEGTTANVWEIGIKAAGGNGMEDFANIPMKDIVNGLASTDETGACETYDEVTSRLMRGLNQAASSVESGNVLVVGHGAAIGNILSMLGYQVEGEIANASVTKIIYKNGTYTVDSVNDMSYSQKGEAVRAQNGGTTGLNAEETVYAAPSGKVTMYFVRHGKTYFNTTTQVQGWSDSILTEAGVLGAVNTGIGMKDIAFDRVYSSDLGRTVETVSLILGQNLVTSSDVPYTKLKNLREMNFGKYEGDTTSVWEIGIKAAGGNGMEDFANIPFNNIVDGIAASDETGECENYEEVITRLKGGLDRIVAESATAEGSEVLVVIHGAALSNILTLIGSPIEGEVPNSSVTKIVYDNGAYTVESVSDLSYMEAGAQENPSKNAPANLMEDAMTETLSFNNEETGKSVVLDSFVVNGTNYVSIDEVAKEIGGSSYYEPHTGRSIYILNGQRLALMLGTNAYYFNDSLKYMDEDYSYYYTSDNETYIPWDLLSETFGQDDLPNDSNYVPDPNENTVNTQESYIVKSGDTLAFIARKLGVTVEELIQMNGLTNPNMIFIGDVLYY